MRGSDGGVVAVAAVRLGRGVSCCSRLGRSGIRRTSTKGEALTAADDDDADDLGVEGSIGSAWSADRVAPPSATTADDSFP